MTHLVSVCLMYAALTWIAAMIAVLACGRMTLRRILGMAAVAYGLLATSEALLRQPFVASVFAAFGAVAAWLWWISGGGDGTKRRLRRLRVRFAPVRRTAPATAMAVTR